MFDVLFLSFVLGANPTTLESAVWEVETGRCESSCPAGDNGNATGPLQIWECAFLDVQREGEVYSDCESLDYSLEVFRRYMKRYATEKRLGRPVTDEDRARIWNGGPRGVWAKGKKKINLDKYWTKVQNALVGTSNN